MDLNDWLTFTVSLGALSVSVIALLVSLSANRSAGPLISIGDHQLAFRAKQWWLEVNVVNSGHSDIDLEGAWAGWLGQTITELPTRLSSNSSKSLIFRGALPPSKFLGDPLTVQVSLGNGSMAMKRIRLSESDIAAQLSRSSAEAQGEGATNLEEQAPELRIEEV